VRDVPVRVLNMRVVTRGNAHPNGRGGQRESHIAMNLPQLHVIRLRSEHGDASDGGVGSQQPQAGDGRGLGV